MSGFKYKRYNSRMDNFNISLTNRLINSVEILYEQN